MVTLAAHAALCAKEMMRRIQSNKAPAPPPAFRPPHSATNSFRCIGWFGETLRPVSYAKSKTARLRSPSTTIRSRDAPRGSAAPKAEMDRIASADPAQHPAHLNDGSRQRTPTSISTLSYDGSRHQYASHPVSGATNCESRSRLSHRQRR